MTVTVHDAPFAQRPPGFMATSATQLSIVDSGQVTFVVGTGRAYAAGNAIRAVAHPTDAYMDGVVVSYAAGSLVMEVLASQGSGLYDAWTINLRGEIAYLPTYPGTISNARITESRATNSATFALKTLGGTDPTTANPARALFQDATMRLVTGPLSVAIPAATALGSVTDEAFRLWFLLINDLGALRLGVLQSRTSGSNNITSLPPSGIIQPAMFGSIAGMVYVAGGVIAQASPFVVIGFAEYDSGLPTAGEWSAAPTRTGLYGPGVKLPGQVVQSVGSQTGAAVAGNTVMPFDATAPQITEGDQCMTQAIVAKSPASVLKIDAKANIGPNQALAIVGAVFKAGVNDALASSVVYTVRNAHEISVRVLAGTTASTTYSYRMGKQSASGTGVTFNGDATVRYFGGLMGSYLYITELQT